MTEKEVEKIREAMGRAGIEMEEAVKRVRKAVDIFEKEAGKLWMIYIESHKKRNVKK